MDNKYDIIVAGGGTAGCAFAYTASKLGFRVLIIEKNSYLGGSMTSSLVTPAMKTSKNSINNDFFNIFYDELKKVNGSITYSDGNKGWYNPELSKIVLDKLMKSVNVDILFESYIDNIEENLSQYIVSVHNDNSNPQNSKLLSLYIDTNNIVDATGDAKICQKLNCEFLEKNETQPINLRFIMSGVNVKSFAKWLLEYDTNRDVTTACTVGGNTYLSTAYTWDTNTKWALKPLFDSAVENGVLKKEDTNYFQIFSIAGTQDSIGFNAPRILDSSLPPSEAYIKGRESILRLSNFCREYFPGWDNAYISSIANTLGVRVSNRVRGKYIYTKDDLISGKTFDHPVVISNYPIDVHSADKNKSKLEKVYKEYQLPVESLIVKDNLFVVGRCISADFEAQAALRIIPSCMSMGEGLAKYLAKKRNIN